jgi:hypothetical protein
VSGALTIFSDLDWAIIVGVGLFLFLGRGDPELLRKIGRIYGRLLAMKQELFGELTKAAGLPPVAPGTPVSLRSTLLGLDPPAVPVPRANYVLPPHIAMPMVDHPDPAVTWVNSLGPEQWSVASIRMSDIATGER